MDNCERQSATLADPSASASFSKRFLLLRLSLFFLRLARARLERSIGRGFDMSVSRQLDRVVLAEEVLEASP